MKTIKPYPGMVIEEDVVFTPGVYDFYLQEGIYVQGNNITIDANHAVFINGQPKDKTLAHETHEEFTYGEKETEAPSRGYYGIALQSKNTAGVTIKNMHAKGFMQALKLENCSDWTIEHNDFSYNYHNMDWGWENHPIRGGVHLISCSNCIIRENKATDVWDAMVLAYSNNNRIENNDFSHTSDTGLKLWRSCGNEILNNDLSWGLRKSPGEVHARDSSCVLVECGSNHNRFYRNDMTYGGDGFFIRSLNGWMSTDNIIEENDMSFANNNAIEAWSNRNTYIRNKVNYSSYGFWLGNSDETVLVENEVAYNGDNFHNAPEAFGNCGIAIVNGSGSHMVIKGNYIHHNSGPGMAIRYKEGYESYQWIIEDNIFEANKNKDDYLGHGIYLKHAKDITLIHNIFNDNEGEEVFKDDNVSQVTFLPGGEGVKPEANIHVASTYFEVGVAYTFSAKKSEAVNNNYLTYHWDFGNGKTSDREEVDITYNQPGFYRMGLSVHDGAKSDMAFHNIYVLPKGKSLHQYEGMWSLSTTGNAVMKEQFSETVGAEVITVVAQQGTDHHVTYSLCNTMATTIASRLSFLLDYKVEAADLENKGVNPIIELVDDKDNKMTITPKKGYLNMYGVSINEYKEHWRYIEIPLLGNEEWAVQNTVDFNLDKVKSVSFHVGPQVDSYCHFTIGGICFYRA